MSTHQQPYKTPIFIVDATCDVPLSREPSRGIDLFAATAPTAEEVVAAYNAARERIEQNERDDAASHAAALTLEQARRLAQANRARPAVTAP